jgi:phenylalanyl-tRNA synthetase beta chain
MRILLDWLSEFTETGDDARSLARALTMSGINVESVEGTGRDAVFEVEVTTNRPDCLSHYGIARETAAAGVRSGLRGGLRPLPRQPLEESPAPASDALRVTIEARAREAPAGCARYCARVLRNVNVGPSPSNVTHRLERMGLRPINNVADITNYTLLEMGHPTHAFDADTLRGREIRVRYARHGEKLVTLDEVERTLGPEDLVIADAERPVALAGVMGGLETAIGERTRNVVIESAWFEPVGIRRTAKRHGLHTDASHRFERGADIEAAPLAADRIAAALRATAGAEVLRGLIDRYPQPRRPLLLRLRATELRRVLGVEAPDADVAAILASLGFGVEAIGAGAWEVSVPSWRLDVLREIDLVEEVGRLYGFDRVPVRLPAFRGSAHPAPGSDLVEGVRRRLMGRGLNEAIAVSFASPAECFLFAPEATPIQVLNPLSEEASIMRTSALPSMLHMLSNNLNRGVENVRLFEIGKVYARVAGHLGAPERAAGASGGGISFASQTTELVPGVRERRVVTLGATGAAEGPAWADSRRPYDFFDLKSDISALLEVFGIGLAEWRPLQRHAPAQDFARSLAGGDRLTGVAPFHPDRSAEILLEGRPIGVAGQLAAELPYWKFKGEVYAAELDLDALLARGARPIRYESPSRFPASERDFSFIFDDRVTWAQIRGSIEPLRLAFLRSFSPLEIFRGGKIPAASYSILMRAQFQGADRTLRDEEINSAAAEIVKALTALGGKQRA